MVQSALLLFQSKTAAGRGIVPCGGALGRGLAEGKAQLPDGAAECVLGGHGNGRGGGWATGRLSEAALGDG